MFLNHLNDDQINVTVCTQSCLNEIIYSTNCDNNHGNDLTKYKKDSPFSGADPGFPVGAGAKPPGGAPTYDFAEKLHEIEKMLARRGRLPGSATGSRYFLSNC